MTPTLHLRCGILLTFLLIQVSAKRIQSREFVDFGTVIGIDLGTTYSVVGVYKNGRVDILQNDQGNRITPSCVAFTLDGERLVGDAAKSQLTSNPANTIFDVKRFIGREWDDPFVEENKDLYPFEIRGYQGKVYFRIETSEERHSFTAEEVSSMILTKMKDIAENVLREKINQAVVTVPAYFNDAQRSATRDAGIIAGLNVTRVLNEPTAAALAYGYGQLKDKGEKGVNKARNVLVFDLGGGTYDVSLLNIEHGVFEVLATNGITDLGGQDFDQRVVDHILSIYEEETGTVVKNNRALQKLRREVERGKRSLSSYTEVLLEIDAWVGGDDFSFKLSRARFEDLNRDLFEATIPPMKQVLKDAGLGVDDVHDVLLVGGSTRIPKIQELVKNFFGGRDIRRDINPDEAIAYGAAIQAAMLGGEQISNSMILLDINPLSVGIETTGGVMSTIIERNTVIPYKFTKEYTTAKDFQDSVFIKVYEGERDLTEDNHLLGTFELDGIEPALRGQAEIEVTFEIDSSGILQVMAEDLKSGHQEVRNIANDYNRLKPEDIRKMVKNAEKFAKEDKLRLARVEARLDLEAYIYTLNRAVKDPNDIGGQLSEDKRAVLEKAINGVIEWLNANPDATTAEYKKIKNAILPKVQKFLQGLKIKRGNIVNDTQTQHFRNEL